MSIIRLTNIQRFSLHDGPGIRTTVFLKGCSLRCPWCSNPENIVPDPQAYVKDGTEGVYGRFVGSDEVVRECLKDKAFYGDAINRWNITTAEEIEGLPGGVTFSGGEPLLQMPQLIPVCKKLHEQQVHIAVETSLFVPPQFILPAIENIDFFFVDIKILDEAACAETEKGDLNQFLANLDALAHSGTPICVRVPVIGTYTDGEENRTAVKALLNKYKESILKIELIKEHKLGESKYRSLQMEVDYHGVDDSLMQVYKSELEQLGIQIEICSI